MNIYKQTLYLYVTYFFFIFALPNKEKKHTKQNQKIEANRKE